MKRWLFPFADAATGSIKQVAFKRCADSYGRKIHWWIFSAGINFDTTMKSPPLKRSLVWRMS